MIVGFIVGNEFIVLNIDLICRGVECGDLFVCSFVVVGIFFDLVL